MKTVIPNMFIALMLLCTNQLLAQEVRQSEMTVEERAEMQTNLMNEKLSLSEEQASLIHDINVKYAVEAEIIRKGGRSRGTLNHLRDMSQRKDKELKNILDKEQYKHYLVLKEEMRQRMKDRKNSIDD